MKGVVTANTGPMIALAMIDRLEILRSIFDKIVVPEAVQEEILEGGKAGVGVSAYIQASWIEKRSLLGRLDPLVGSVLDKGEASVIQVAREGGADWVLIDERKARKVARDVYQLNVVGSAGVMVAAKRRGLVDSVADELTRMRERGYWLHEEIVVAAMRAAGER